MESSIARLKEDNRLKFLEQEDLNSLRGIANTRIRYFNQMSRHSARGNKSSIKYLKEKDRLFSHDSGKK